MNKFSKLTQLTPKQKKQAQQNYVQFTRMNALSYGSLGDSILILYAIKFGASDPLIAFLSSLIYMTMPSMLLGKRLISKVGTSRAFGFSWLGRNFSAALMILTPFFFGRMDLAWLLFSASGFFFFRSMGMAAMTPMLGDISTKSDQGQFISRVWMNGNLFFVIVYISLASVLGHSSSIPTFQFIIAFGSLTGMTSTYFLFKIPKVQQTVEAGKELLRSTWKASIENPQIRLLFLNWALINASIALTLPFGVLTLKKGYNFSDQNALIFTIIQLAGATGVSYLNSILLDRVGPRPMMFFYTAGMALINVLWMIAPDTPFLFHLTIIFLLNGVCSSGNQTALHHYFLGSVPLKHRLNGSILVNISAGIITGLMGTAIGGGLLKLIRYFSLEGITVYRFYFLVIVFYQLLVLSLVYRLKPLSDRRIKDVLSILFSIRDWRALYTLQKLANSQDELESLHLMERLKHIKSNISENLLREFLQSPRFYVRTRAMNALREINFSNETGDLLIAELERGEYTTGYLAAEVLGEHDIYKAIPHLRKAIDSDDVFLQGKALVALVRLRDEPSFEKIIYIFKQTRNPRLIIHGGHALVLMQKPELSLTILEKIVEDNLPTNVFEELLFCLCEVCGVGESFYQLFRNYQDNPEIGRIALTEYLQTQMRGNYPGKSNLLRIAHQFCQPDLVVQTLVDFANNNENANNCAFLPFLKQRIHQISNASHVEKLLFTVTMITGTNVSNSLD
ncbi:MFS transporter [candidate division KSB1 bacterium]|nr:MFS transporter [candidate division KSB1 bacterium]